MAEHRHEERASGSPRQPIRISGQDARGGEIILRTRRRRVIFVSGLIGLILLVLLVRFAGLA